VVCWVVMFKLAFKLPIIEIARDIFAKEKPLETVKNIDINRYQGVWHSVYEFPAWFQVGCRCTKAEYVVKNDRNIEVKNSCLRNGKLKESVAVAWPITEGDNSKLYVKFKNPFKGKYYIISLDADYRYALVGTPNRHYLWMLSREKEIDDNTFNSFKNKAQELGFDTSRLTKVDQTCSER